MQIDPPEMSTHGTREGREPLPLCVVSKGYIGPFPIQRHINEITYQLQLPARYRIHPTFHVSLLKTPSTTGCTKPDAPSPPDFLEKTAVYQVRDTLDLRRWGTRLEYLVDREGYGPEERSLAARDDILDALVLEEFHQSRPNCPAPRGHSHPCHHVRASGAAPGGGGNVRQSLQSPQSAAPMFTGSQSPVL